MPDNRRRRPARVIEVARDRFAAGWRLLPGDAVVVQPGLPRRRVPEIVFDVVRPADLVALTVECYGLELVGGSKPLLRPKHGVTSFLVVQLPFQHLAERAIYEAPALVPNQAKPDGPPAPDGAAVDGEVERPVPPIPARPARPSRLVFDVPADEEIAFSVCGILDAMGRLPMVVHPLATPRPGPFVVRPGGPVLHLPGGLVATLGASGVAVTRPTRGTSVPDSSTAAGISSLARDLRRARSILSSTAGVAVRIPETDEGEQPLTVTLGGTRYVVPSLLGRGGLVRPNIGRRVRPAKRLSRPPSSRLPSKPPSVSSSRRVGAGGAMPTCRCKPPTHPTGWSSGTAGSGCGSNPAMRSESTKEPTVNESSAPSGPETGSAFRIGKIRRPTESHHDPFRTSLDGADRHMLVRQTAETWLGKQSKPIQPLPEPADALYLSSLGAWLDLHGTWTTPPTQKPDSSRSCRGTTSRRWGAISSSGSCTRATSIHSDTGPPW